MSTKDLWKDYNGKGFSAEHAKYAERATRDEDGNDIVDTYALKNAIPTVMTGATSQAAGTAGLVPAPAVADKDKFLKGDGTWTAPPEVNLANYYYDEYGNGLSAKRTSGARPYGTTSLVGGVGNMNSYDINATFYIDWGGVARNFFSVNTVNSGASCIGFGTRSDNSAAKRYLLPAPVANKYAKTNAEGKIVWGDVPSLPSPSIDDSLLLGQSDGSKTWTALAKDTFGSLTDETGDDILDEEGNSIGDENSVELWTSFNGIGFGAERAVADVDGNSLNLTISNDQVIAIGGKSIGGGTVVDAYTKSETDNLLSHKVDAVQGKCLSTNDYSTEDKNNVAANTIARHSHSNTTTLDKIPTVDGHGVGSILTIGNNGELNWELDAYEDYAFGLVIDGREYNTVQIGDQLWTSENLDYAWSGLAINPGLSYDKAAGYYFNSASSTRKIAGFHEGMLYNNKAVLELAASNLIPTGWRIPNKADFDKLIMTVAQMLAGTGKSAYTALTLGSGWAGTYANGDNSLGFNWVHNGTRHYNYGWEWTDTNQMGYIGGVNNGQPNNMYFFSHGTSTIETASNSDMFCTIRLVKDIT